MVSAKIRLRSLQPKMENAIESAKTRPGADCGSDHELLIAKFRLKLKKIRKTTRPFWYDLNQIDHFKYNQSSVLGLICFHFFEASSQNCGGLCHGNNLVIM